MRYLAESIIFFLLATLVSFAAAQPPEEHRPQRGFEPNNGAPRVGPGPRFNQGPLLGVQTLSGQVVNVERGFLDLRTQNGQLFRVNMTAFGRQPLRASVQGELKPETLKRGMVIRYTPPAADEEGVRDIDLIAASPGGTEAVLGEAGGMVTGEIASTRGRNLRVRTSSQRVRRIELAEDAVVHVNGSDHTLAVPNSRVDVTGVMTNRRVILPSEVNIRLPGAGGEDEPGRGDGDFALGDGEAKGPRAEGGDRRFDFGRDFGGEEMAPPEDADDRERTNPFDLGDPDESADAEPGKSGGVFGKPDKPRRILKIN